MGSVSSRPFSQHEGGILEVLFGKQDPHLKSQGQGDLVWLTSDPTPLGPLMELDLGRGRQGSESCMIFLWLPTQAQLLAPLPPAG